MENGPSEAAGADCADPSESEKKLSKDYLLIFIEIYATIILHSQDSRALRKGQNITFQLSVGIYY